MNFIRRAASRIRSFLWPSRKPDKAQPSSGKADFLTGLHRGAVYGKRSNQQEREATARRNRAIKVPQDLRRGPQNQYARKKPMHVQRYKGQKR